MRPLHHPSKSDLDLASVLFALSDPTRLHIVRTLAERGEIICAAVDLPLSKSSCSRHWKVLREAGLIRMQARGTSFVNGLRRQDLEERFPGLLAAVLQAAGGAPPPPTGPAEGAC